MQVLLFLCRSELMWRLCSLCQFISGVFCVHMLMCTMHPCSCAHVWFNIPLVPFQRFQGLPSEDKDLLLCSRKCRRYVPVSYWGCDSHAVNSYKPRPAGCCFVGDWCNRETHTHKHTSTECIICFHASVSHDYYSPPQVAESPQYGSGRLLRAGENSPGPRWDSSQTVLRVLQRILRLSGQQLYKSVEIERWHITLLPLAWGVMRNTWIIILPHLHLTRSAFVITDSLQ